MIKETGTACANFLCVDSLCVARKAAHIHSCLERTAASQAIRVVRRHSAVDCLSHETVALIVMHRRDRTIDGNFVKIWPTETQQLRVEIREKPSLQQRIVCEIYAGNNIPGVKSHLFCFSKEILGIDFTND